MNKRKKRKKLNNSKTSKKENGFQSVVLGHTMRVKVWIHYFIEDTKGKNKWLGQYPGNREGAICPYCDCKCQFHDLSNLNPNCIYLTMEDINLAKIRKQDNEDAGIKYYCSMCVCVCVCVCSCPPVEGSCPLTRYQLQGEFTPPNACNVIPPSDTPSASP